MERLQRELTELRETPDRPSQVGWSRWSRSWRRSAAVCRFSQSRMAQATAKLAGATKQASDQGGGHRALQRKQIPGGGLEHLRTILQPRDQVIEEAREPRSMMAELVAARRQK